MGCAKTNALAHDAVAAYAASVRLVDQKGLSIERGKPPV
jgi:hypothetical protein